MKKILSLISLVAVLTAGGLILSGCTEEQATQEIYEPQVMENENTVPSQYEEVVPVEEVTDASLEADLKALDTDMDTIKTTGFEQTDLSDKDLGL